MDETATATVTTAIAGRWIDRAHDLLLFLLIFLGLLLGSEDPGANGLLVYAGLVLAAWLLLGWEALRHGRSVWRWTGSGLLLLLAWLLAAGAARRAPDAMPAWGWWAAWGLPLAAGGYLLQTIPGRRRLLLAALAGSLVLHLALAWGGWGLAQPLAEQLLTADGATADPAATAATRVWAATGSPTTLAGLILLLTLPLVGSAMRRWQRWRTGSGQDPPLSQLTVPWILAGLAVIVCIPLGAGSLLLWLPPLAVFIALRQRWPRVALAGAALLLLGGVGLLLLLTPAALPAPLAGLGRQWQAAATLWWQQPFFGRGFGAFEYGAASQLPAGSAVDHWVPAFWLQVLLVGGLPTALAAGAWWLGLLRPMPVTGPDAASLDRRGQRQATWWPLFLLPLLLPLLPVWHELLSYWPGGRTASGGIDEVSVLLWAVLLGGLGTLAGRWALDLDDAPAWSIELPAVLLIVLGLQQALIGHLGLLVAIVAVAVLLGDGRARRLSCPRWCLPVAGLGLLGACATTGWLRQAGQQTRAGVAALAEVHAIRTGTSELSPRDGQERMQQILLDLAEQQRWPELSAGQLSQPDVLHQLWDDLLLQAWSWPFDGDSALALARIAPVDRHLIVWRRLSERWPASAAVWFGRARTEAAAGELEATVASLERARQLASWDRQAVQQAQATIAILIALRPDQQDRLRRLQDHYRRTLAP